MVSEWLRLPMLRRDPGVVRSIYFQWEPSEEGTLFCVCCGLHAGCEMQGCGLHAYCGLCLRRGHEEGHECGDAPPSALRRMDQDCHGCGERHQDWERCAEAVRVLYQVAKAREEATP